MGGYGSGSWYRGNTKALVTSCLSLDVSRLHKDGLLGPDAMPNSGTVFECTWQGGPGEPKSSIGIQVDRDQLTLFYRHDDIHGEWQDITAPVPVTWTPCST